MRIALCLALLAFAPAASGFASLPQTDGASREQQALSDEQSLIVRKLTRLRASMERLAERYETEGRAHAAGLLRGALEHLDERERESAGKTLDELMNEAESGLTAGQVVQAIEDQKSIVADLERLLSILMDRPDLDQLEQELQKLRDYQERLRGLADQESAIRKQTKALREQSKNAAQRSLEEQLTQISSKQAEMLRSNETEARNSGALQLEALEARLEDLLKDQNTDLEVARSWRPEARDELSELLGPLEMARAESMRAERLEAAAEGLRELARASAPDAAEGELERKLAEVDAAAEREEIHARAGGDPAAEQAAQALRAAARAAREGQPEAAEAQATALSQAAAERRASAEAAHAQASEKAADLEAATPELRQALARAEQAADADAAAEALGALRRALDEQRFLGQALSASQDQNAKRAAALSEALQRAELDEQAAQDAQQALERAAQAMEQAADQASKNSASASAEAAQAASEALQEARAALQQARSQSAQQNSEPAERQAQLAEQTAALEQQAQEASLSPSAQQSVQQQLDRAQQAMREASQSLEQGQRGEAAKQQREALEALDQAARESESGTQPESAEQRQQAKDLAEAQRAVEQQLYEFKRAYEEAQRETPLPSLEQAQQHAKQAGQKLEQGDLEGAEQEAKRTERKIEEALDELNEEERQYQRLRDEELLFKIAEEVVGMLETHERLFADTRELDADRKPGARASRSQKLRLRKLSREVKALSARAGELRTAIAEEGSTVFAELFRRVEEDLLRLSRSLGEVGGYSSGARVQALFDDVGRDLRWLLESLQEEKDRREQEESQGGQDGQPPPDGENRLVPDQAELKLLQHMERDVLDSLAELLVLYPELGEGGEIDPLLLEEISRLAQRHGSASKLFSTFRERLGLPDPEAEAEAEDGHEEQ